MDANSTQSSGLFDFMAWLDANLKKVLMGAVVVIIAVAAFAFYSWNQKKTEMEANRSLLAVSSRGPAAPSTATADDYLKIAQQHPNTAAAERAGLLAATTAFEKGDYAKAQSQFDSIQKSAKDNTFKAQAAFGVGASLEAQKNLDAALKQYDDVAKSYPKENVAPQAKLATARIYEAQNKPEQAQQIYTEIESAPNSFEFWKGDAAERRDRLEARFPQLKKTVAAQDQVIEVTTPPAPAPAPAK